MIIHYTIAKNNHHGRKNARQLERLIQNADVVSPENAFTSEEEAQMVENGFKRIISSSRKHRRRFEATAASHREDEYNALIQNYIVRYQKPVVLLERFSDQEEVERLKKLYHESLKMMTSQVPELFHREELEEGMRTYFKAIGKMAEFTGARDRNIAENAARIAPRIVKLCPHLASRPELDYLVIIGGFHNIEEVMENIPDATVKAINFSNPDVTSRQLHLIGRSIQEGATYESCRPQLAQLYLANSIALVLPSLLHRHDLAYLLVSKLGLPDAEELNLRLKTATSGIQREKVISEFFGQKGVTIPRTASELDETYQRLLREVN